MGVAQVFVGKIFVHRLQTTKSTKILSLENYPLYGSIHVLSRRGGTALTFTSKDEVKVIYFINTYTHT